MAWDVGPAPARRRRQGGEGAGKGQPAVEPDLDGGAATELSGLQGGECAAAQEVVAARATGGAGGVALAGADTVEGAVPEVHGEEAARRVGPDERLQSGGGGGGGDGLHERPRTPAVSQVGVLPGGGGWG